MNGKPPALMSPGPPCIFTNASCKRDDLSRAVETRGEIVPAVRAVVVVREVMLARPHQLDRRALEPLRDRRRLDRKLVAATPAEAAAESRDVHDDVLGRETESARDETLADRGNLRRRPHLHHAVLEDRRAVLRFERRVREKRIVVDRFDGLRAVRERSPAASTSRAAPPASPSRRCSGSRPAPSFHLTCSASVALNAFHVESATIATPDGSPSMPSSTNASRTPGRVLHVVEVGAHDLAAERPGTSCTSRTASRAA